MKVVEKLQLLGMCLVKEQDDIFYYIVGCRMGLLGLKSDMGEV